jgi:hypothetical protein
MLGQAPQRRGAAVRATVRNRAEMLEFWLEPTGRLRHRCRDAGEGSAQALSPAWMSRARSDAAVRLTRVHVAIAGTAAVRRMSQGSFLFWPGVSVTEGRLPGRECRHSRSWRSKARCGSELGVRRERMAQVGGAGPATVRLKPQGSFLFWPGVSVSEGRAARSVESGRSSGLGTRPIAWPNVPALTRGRHHDDASGDWKTVPWRPSGSRRCWAKRHSGEEPQSARPCEIEPKCWSSGWKQRSMAGPT